MKINNKLCVISAIVLSAIFASCSSDDSFQNKIYDITPIEQDVLVKLGTETATKTLQASIAQPELSDINITYVVDLSAVDTYNNIYNDAATALPADYYQIADPNAVIKAGSIESNEVTVTFKNLNTLDMTKTYVLPVSIANSTSIPLLTSKQTTYFVVKEAALINTVADMEGNYISFKTWNDASALNNLKTITMEALINAKTFDTNLPNGETKSFISSIMGIEGGFLIRAGDAGIPNNQLQIATNSGNVTDPSLLLPTNQWCHIAMTYDANAHEMKIYIDGKLATDQKNVGPGSISLGSSDFYIGRSYDDTRYLVGNMSEVRIWNVVRTSEEIANNEYYVDPASPGLVAYWKLDEGVGSTVHDYSASGNNGEANAAIKWVSVNLPAK